MDSDDHEENGRNQKKVGNYLMFPPSALHVALEESWSVITKDAGQSTRPVGAYGSNPATVMPDDNSVTPFGDTPPPDVQQTIGSTGDDKSPQQKMNDKDAKAKEYSETTLRQLANDIHLQSMLSDLDPKTSGWQRDLTELLHRLGPSKSQNDARKEVHSHGKKILEAIEEMNRLHASGHSNTSHTPNSPHVEGSRPSDGY
jgi:hypothetical protein